MNKPTQPSPPMQLLVRNRPVKKGSVHDCLVQNVEVSDYMIAESVAAHSSRGKHASALSFEYRRMYNSIALALGDIFALTAALYITGALRYALLGEPLYQWWLQLIVPVWLLASFAARLYPGWGLGAVEELRRHVLTLTTVFTMAAVLLFFTQLGAETSRFAIATSFLLSLGLVPGVRRFVKYLLVRSGQYGLPTVIYGAGKAGRDLVRSLDEDRGLGYTPVAFLDDHPAYWGAHLRGIPVLGDTNLVLPDAQVAILAMPDVENDFRRHLLDGPLSYYRHVIILPDLNELPSLWVGTIDMGGTLGLKISLNLADPISRLVKRMFDITATVLTAPLWIPFVALLAGLIWLEDRKNPFFLQDRVGREGKPFRTWKFRTMVKDADRALRDALANDAALKAEWEANFKLRNDPRITRIGRFIRKTSMDELPQLFNVLGGSMSLVGPRPLPEYHDQEVDARVQHLRRRVRPGMTGLWQVSGRSDIGTDGMEQYDSYYVRNWSIWLDIVVITRTFRAVVQSAGAY